MKFDVTKTKDSQESAQLKFSLGHSSAQKRPFQAGNSVIKGKVIIFIITLWAVGACTNDQLNSYEKTWQEGECHKMQDWGDRNRCLAMLNPR